MSEGKINQFVDFEDLLNYDVGNNQAASITPIENGEDVDASVLGRPPEVLRRRSEKLRGVLRDLMYAVDADRSLLLGGPGAITWPGSTTALASGIPVVTGNVYLVPALTPGHAQVAPIPPVKSAYGALTLLKDTPADGLIITSNLRSSNGGDTLNVEILADTLDHPALEAILRDRATYKVYAPAGTTLGQVKAAMNLLTNGWGESPCTITNAGGAVDGDLIQIPQARQFGVGNYDGEGHTITPANLASFFVSNPTSALAEGDSLCIQYTDMVAAAGTGGRRQALPENSNTAVPAGAFFNSRVNPEKLVNALPICKVLNGKLVFINGTQIDAGATAQPLGGSSAASTNYNGGPAWYDGTTNPATTVEAQLDKIITDLVAVAAGNSGADRIGIGPESYTFGAQLAGSIAGLFYKFDEEKANLNTANDFYGSHTVTPADETDANGQVLATSVAPVGLFKPLFKFQGATGKTVRVYHALTDSGLVFTVNAVFNNGTVLWTADSAAEHSLKISLSRMEIKVQRRPAGAGTWADGAWTSAPFTQNAQLGTLAITGLLEAPDASIAGTMTAGVGNILGALDVAGAVAINNNVGITGTLEVDTSATINGNLYADTMGSAVITTGEADVRHSTRTIAVHPACALVLPATNVAVVNGNLATAIGGATFHIPLPLQLGQRLTAVRAYVDDQAAGSMTSRLLKVDKSTGTWATVGASDTSPNFATIDQLATGAINELVATTHTYVYEVVAPAAGQYFRHLEYDVTRS